MDEKTQKIIESLKQSHLSHDERIFLRKTIERSMDENNSFVPTKRISIWYWFSESHRFVVAGAFAVFVLFTGGTLAFAEQALPGDFLYGVKTQITENVLRAINSNSPIAKVTFETRIMEKRLVEAEDVSKKEKQKISNNQGLKIGVVNQEKRLSEALSGLVVASTTTAKASAVAPKKVNSSLMMQETTVTTENDDGKVQVSSSKQQVDSKRTTETLKEENETEQAVESITTLLERHKDILEKIHSDESFDEVLRADEDN